MSLSALVLHDDYELTVFSHIKSEKAVNSDDIPVRYANN
jgi:hypothetical protein